MSKWNTPTISRREFALGAAFLGVAGLAAAKQPHSNINLLGDAKIENVIPKQIGDWQFVSASGLVVPPEDQLSRALYSQLLTRVYANPAGQAMMLLIAQSANQTGILQIHRPEICYGAGGYRLSGLHRHPIDILGRELPTMVLSATADTRTEQVLYWTRIGHHLPLSWIEQRKAVAIDNLHGAIPDAVLVRVSTLASEEDSAVPLIDQFVEAMFRSVSPNIRRFLMG